MTHRLYLGSLADEDSPLGVDTTLELNREQSHYLTRVLRLKAGANLLCFDGRGQEWEASVSNVDGKRAMVRLGAICRTGSATSLPLILAIGWLKGAAMDTVVQKDTELGVDGLQVLHAERSNVRLDEKRIANKLRHWQQIAVSASEQSNRLFVPEIPPPIAFTDLLNGTMSGRWLMLEPGADTLDAGESRSALTLLIGPEGGWSEEEKRLARAQGIEFCGLGNLTLRAETAPLAALAAVQHSWGWSY
mgnify:FL=1